MRTMKALTWLVSLLRAQMTEMSAKVPLPIQRCAHTPAGARCTTHEADRRAGGQEEKRGMRCKGEETPQIVSALH